LKNFKHHLCHYLAKRQLEPYPELKDKTSECLVYSSALQLFVITMKSIQHDAHGVILDLERMKDELLLWPYYAEESAEEKDIYLIGMWPLVLTHDDINQLNVALRQYVEVLSLGPEWVPDIFFFAYYLREAILSDDATSIFEAAKSHLIGLSFSELFQEKDQRKLIAFEKARINILMGIKLDWIENMFASTDKDEKGELESTGFLRLMSRFYDYLIRVKNGRVNIPPYVKNRQKLYHLKPGETVQHGLLGKTQMILNLDVHHTKILIINTPYGCYRLRDKR
jgi:hypothetical protein